MATHQRLEEERNKWRIAGRDAAAAQDGDAQDPVARAMQLRARGDSEGALLMLKEALSASAAQFGPAHQRVTTVYNEIGNLLDSQGKYTEAIEYYLRAA